MNKHNTCRCCFVNLYLWGPDRKINVLDPSLGIGMPPFQRVSDRKPQK